MPATLGTGAAVGLSSARDAEQQEACLHAAAEHNHASKSEAKPSGDQNLDQGPSLTNFLMCKGLSGNGSSSANSQIETAPLQARDPRDWRRLLHMRIDFVSQKRAPSRFKGADSQSQNDSEPLGRGS